MVVYGPVCSRLSCEPGNLTMGKLPLSRAEKRRTRRLKKIGQMLERGLREDAIRHLTHCKIEDIFDARKLLNKEATPETNRKSRIDTLGVLESRGELTEHHLAAAEEICKAKRFITDEVRCRIASLEARVDTFGSRSIENESEYSVRIQQQYKLWRFNCTRSRIDVKACMFMIENQATLKEADKHFGRRYGYTKTHLVWGLGLYCSLFRPMRKN